MQIHSPARM